MEIRRSLNTLVGKEKRTAQSMASCQNRKVKPKTHRAGAVNPRQITGETTMDEKTMMKIEAREKINYFVAGITTGAIIGGFSVYAAMMLLFF